MAAFHELTNGYADEVTPQHVLARMVAETFGAPRDDGGRLTTEVSGTPPTVGMLIRLMDGHPDVTAALAQLVGVEVDLATVEAFPLASSAVREAD